MKLHHGMLLTVTGIAAAWLAVPVQADVTATYQSDDETMVVSVRDAQHVRMGNDSEYTLLSGDKTYAVRRDGKGWAAMDMAEMQSLSKGMAALQEQQAGMYPDEDEEQDPVVESVTNTGRTATVAGYRGKVFEVTYDNGDQAEVVLTNDVNVVAVTEGLHQLIKRSAENSGFANMLENQPDLPKGYRGILEADGLVLQKIDSSDKGKQYFSLPAGVRMETLSGRMMGESGMQGGPDSETIQKMMREAQKRMQEAMQ